MLLRDRVNGRYRLTATAPGKRKLGNCIVALLLLLAPLGLAGSVLLLIAAVIHAACSASPPRAARASVLERWLVGGGLLASLCGGLMLLVGPVYSVTRCSITNTAANTVRSSCVNQRESLLQTGGGGIWVLVALPVLLSVIPCALPGCRFRAMVYALCAFLLAATGFTGLGLIFIPSSLVLIVSGVLSMLPRSGTAPVDESPRRMG